jgi:hypothetical protein
VTKLCVFIAFSLRRFDGFIYYQYWFGNGKMLLENLQTMLKNKNIVLPFVFVGQMKHGKEFGMV